MKNIEQKPLFAPSEFWRIVIVLVIMVCGFATRLYDLTDPPLDYASGRQLRSAIIARGIYIAQADNVPDWQREIARKQLGSQEMLEPEILENLAAFIYLIAGGEYIWIARILSSLFWTLGGLALYTLTRKMVSDDTAVIALLFYLFVPFGLLASRSFQPDPLMTAMIITAWLCYYYWSKTKSLTWAWAAGLSAGIAIFIKSTAVFFLGFGMAGVILTEYKFKDLLKNVQIWLIGFLSVLPTFLYHLYGFFIIGNMKGQLKGRLFISQLWNDPDFYLQWLSTTSKVVGHLVILLIALVGLFLLRDKFARCFLVWTWFGFVVYGFAFSYYVTTHGYYLLPVIPLVGVTLGAASDWIFTGLKKIKFAPLIWMGTNLVLLIGVAGGYYIYHSDDFRHEPAYYQKVASVVTPDDRVIAISQDFGYRLAYYGWIIVQPWQGVDVKSAADSDPNGLVTFSNHFTVAVEGYDYFIITSMKEFRQQTQLAEELYGHYSIKEEGGGYIIFDLNERIEYK